MRVADADVHDLDTAVALGQSGREEIGIDGVDGGR
jgi:hypothetical protein